MRLLVIGVNLDSDGFACTKELAQEARREIRQGKKRIRFTVDYATYRGSLLWYRMGCYAAIFAEAASHIEVDLNNLTDETVAAAFDFIA